MEEFEPSINQINEDIKPTWEDIKHLSEKLVTKLIVNPNILIKLI